MARAISIPGLQATLNRVDRNGGSPDVDGMSTGELRPQIEVLRAHCDGSGATSRRGLDSPPTARDSARALDAWSHGLRELRALGVCLGPAVGVARRVRSWWRVSTQLLHVASTFEFFDELGLPRLAPAFKSTNRRRRSRTSRRCESERRAWSAAPQPDLGARLQRARAVAPARGVGRRMRGLRVFA